MPSVHKASRMLQKLWQPRLFLDPPAAPSTSTANDRPAYAVVVLNRPINLPKRLAMSLWNGGRTLDPTIARRLSFTPFRFSSHAAAQRVLVDGGANQWLRFADQRLSAAERAQLRRADMLTGDMDSVREATRAKLAAAGTRIVRTPDQDHTDYTKALLELRPALVGEQRIRTVVTLVDSSGRIDHIMANINTMCKALELLPAGTEVLVMCGESMSWLLEAGEHCIEVPPALVRAQRWCSYVPIGGACTVTTTGFKWDLSEYQGPAPVQ